MNNNQLMPLSLDKIDTDIIKSLLKDGRKSFRQISRETGITTPTVKARYDRLVNIGFIKGVMPVFDFEKVNSSDEKRKLLQIHGVIENRITRKNSKEQIDPFNRELSKIEKRITKGLSINVICDYCEGPIYGKPRILKFADIERFFCCISCKSGYKEKYRGRIESIKRKYEGKSDIDV